ncbi:ABC transporter permease subunit [Marmoricola sp. RAF53]|uniref:ABC transporter permease subunit n=1 Tax=Marmoricola sp. RAF53 TaxID=3233059 RepID=UPI003F965431
MTGLIGNELRRYRSRPVIVLLVVAAALLATVLAGVTAWESRPPSRSELATAKVQQNLAQGSAELKKCLADPTNYLGPGATQQQCRDVLPVDSNAFLPREPLDLRGTLEGNGLGTALLVAVLLIIAGCVFAGSDFTSGSISAQALFAPGRTRLWIAKAVAVGAWSATVSLVVLGGFWLAMYLLAQDRGVPHGSALLDDIVWHVARAVLLCTGAALGAYALTMIFRHAAATLGLLFALSIGGEIVLALSTVEGLARWTLGANVLGWLQTRLVYVDGGLQCGIADCDQRERLTHPDAGLYLLALLVVAMVASVLTFRRRDL